MRNALSLLAAVLLPFFAQGCMPADIAADTGEELVEDGSIEQGADDDSLDEAELGDEEVITFGGAPVWKCTLPGSWKGWSKYQSPDLALVYVRATGTSLSGSGSMTVEVEMDGYNFGTTTAQANLTAGIYVNGTRCNTVFKPSTSVVPYGYVFASASCTGLAFTGAAPKIEVRDGSSAGARAEFIRGSVNNQIFVPVTYTPTVTCGWI